MTNEKKSCIVDDYINICMVSFIKTFIPHLKKWMISVWPSAPEICHKKTLFLLDKLISNFVCGFIDLRDILCKQLCLQSNITLMFLWTIKLFTKLVMAYKEKIMLWESQLPALNGLDFRFVRCVYIVGPYILSDFGCFLTSTSGMSVVF